MIDTLEQRRLLSATVTVGFSSALGLISVVGTDQAEQIDVTVDYTLIQPVAPTLNAPPVLDQPIHAISTSRMQAIEGATVTISVNEVMIRRFVLPLSSLKRVQLFGGAGDDALTISNCGTPIATAVSGDAGNDTIHAANAAGAPGVNVWGGDGNDVIYLWACKGALVGHTARGEGGDDLIFGSALGDTIWGDAESPRPNVHPGDDTVFAGAGDDIVWGGDGNDILCGEEGDDWLCGDGGSDFVDGGVGEDTGVLDPSDKFVDLEKIVFVA